MINVLFTFLKCDVTQSVTYSIGYSSSAEHLLTNNNLPYEDVHMWKRLLLVTAVSAAMSSMAMAAPLTVGFSQVGSESGWRAAETNVAKSEA